MSSDSICVSFLFMCSLSNVSFQLPEIHKTDDYEHLYKVTKKAKANWSKAVQIRRL